MLISEQELMASVSEVLRVHGCEAAAIGPNGYHRRAFGHVYGPSIIIKPPAQAISPEAFDALSAEVVAKVSGVCGLSLNS